MEIADKESVMRVGGPTFEDLTIDERLDDIERIAKYATSHIALQRLVHVNMLAGTARAAGYERTKQFIFPLLETIANDDEVVLRQHFSVQLEELAKVCADLGGEEGYSAIINTILPPLAQLVSDMRADVRISAGESLVAVASLIRPDDLGPHVLTIVLQLAHDDETEDMRMTAAVLFNALAEVLGPELCEQFVVPEIIALAEDPVFRVRKAAAMNMDAVCRTAGPDRALKKLLPVFVMLSKDDVWGVRKACAESLMSISRSVTPQARVEQLVPLFERFATDASKWVRQAAVQHLGPFISTIPGEKITDKLLSRYIAMAVPHANNKHQSQSLAMLDHDPELIAYCAFAFPGVVLTLGKNRWDDLKGLFVVLSRDPQRRVRRPIAYSLHEIAKILGPTLSEEHLLSVFDMFMTDVDEVKLGMVTHLADFLAALSMECRECYLPVLGEVLTATAPLSWRFRHLLALQLNKLANLFSAAATYSVVAPLALRLLQDPVHEVRNATASHLAALLLRLAEHDESWMQDLVVRLHNWANHSSYIFRLTFLKVCRSLIQELPSEMFAKYFLPQLETLATNKVRNIRLAVAEILLLAKEAKENKKEESAQEKTNDSAPNASEVASSSATGSEDAAQTSPSSHNEENSEHQTDQTVSNPANTSAVSNETPHESQASNHDNQMEDTTQESLHTEQRSDRRLSTTSVADPANATWVLDCPTIHDILNTLSNDRDVEVRRYAGGDVDTLLQELKQEHVNSLQLEITQAHENVAQFDDNGVVDELQLADAHTEAVLAEDQLQLPEDIQENTSTAQMATSDSTHNESQ